MQTEISQESNDIVAAAVNRATERHVSQLMDGQETVRFSDLLNRPLLPVIKRVLKSVETTYWRHELNRREKDKRFDYSDPSFQTALSAWNEALRSHMLISISELNHFTQQALELQVEAILSPVRCIEHRFFSTEPESTLKSVLLVATRLGIDDRYLRALNLMAREDENRVTTIQSFQRILRDVDAKEFSGNRNQAALAALSHLLLVLGLRTEDEPGMVPVDLACAVMDLCATPEATETVRTHGKGKKRLIMSALSELFQGEASSVPESKPLQDSEEIERFLDDIGVDSSQVQVMENAGSTSGNVRFILTDEEKLAYVSRAVGRHGHLIEPIMKAIEGALTWEEVDHAIVELIPDYQADVNLKKRDFRSRIRNR